MQTLHNYLAPRIFKALYRCVFITLGITLFFSGCSKKTSTQLPIQLVNTLRLGNAKHFDIPQPLGFTATTRQSSLDGDYLLYVGTQARPKVIDFYMRAMESNGWDIQNFSNHCEGLLVCSKPHKTCTISIRSEKDISSVHVFVKQSQ